MEKITTNSILTLVLCCCNFLFLTAQDDRETSDLDQKLAKQFNFLLEKSSSFQNYKVVDKEKMLEFQAILDDYILKEQVSRDVILLELENNKKAIASLNEQIELLNKENIALQENSSSFSFASFRIDKTVYSLGMWILVFGLISFLAVFYLKFQRANEITQSSKSVLKDLEDEYESFRRVCIQREQNLKRKLFDEMKKSNGLKNAS